MGNKLIYFVPFNLIVRPLIKNYLQSVIGGLKLYAEKIFDEKKSLW